MKARKRQLAQPDVENAEGVLFEHRYHPEAE
jgi:hypothetical protein